VRGGDSVSRASVAEKGGCRFATEQPKAASSTPSSEAPRRLLEASSPPANIKAIAPLQRHHLPGRSRATVLEQQRQARSVRSSLR
jgi:hypothetical protein